jgi:hypothetical protein
MLIAGALALVMAGYSPLFISHYFMGTLVGLAIAGLFAISASFLIKGIGFWLGFFAALGVWLVIAGLAVFLRLWGRF